MTHRRRARPARRAGGRPRGIGRARAGGRRGEDHPARRLVDDVAGRSPTKVSCSPCLPPQAGRRARATAPRRRARSPPRRAGAASRTIASPARARAHRGRGDLDALVLLAHGLGARRAPCARRWSSRLGHARVERQRHRDLEHPQRLDHRAALAGSSFSSPASRPAVCMMSSSSGVPEDGHEDRAELRARPPGAVSASAGHRHALEHRLALGRAGRRRRARRRTSIQPRPTMRAASCRASTETKATADASAPSTAGSGSVGAADADVEAASGTGGRGRARGSAAGSRERCTSMNASVAPNA